MDDNDSVTRREFEKLVAGVESITKDLIDLRVDFAVLKTKVAGYVAVGIAIIELGKHFLLK